MHPGRHGAGAVGFDLAAAQVAQQAFGHLRAGAVVGAEEEHAETVGEPGSQLGQVRIGPEAGVDAGGGHGEAVAELGEVETVIDVALVGRAAAFAHQLVPAQLAQVVGNQVLRLVKKRNQLADLAVASGESLDQAPTLVVGQQLEQGREPAEVVESWWRDVMGAMILNQLGLMQRGFEPSRGRATRRELRNSLCVDSGRTQPSIAPSPVRFR